ncbi:MAG: hypothetical protein FJ279_28025, partial [Planctomycetes bacterium]|nr:hypothetical protein [Planctomycetota bacterium]
MKPRIGWLLAAMLGGAVAASLADEERQVTFRVLLSAKEKQKMQDWSGRAEVTGGKVLRVAKDYDGKNDLIHDDLSWTVVYGRMLAADPKAQAPQKALLVTVSAEQEATVRIKTKAGDFEFRLAEALKGPVERLDGNV